MPVLNCLTLRTIVSINAGGVKRRTTGNLPVGCKTRRRDFSESNSPIRCARRTLRTGHRWAEQSKPARSVFIFAGELSRRSFAVPDKTVAEFCTAKKISVAVPISHYEDAVSALTKSSIRERELREFPPPPSRHGNCAWPSSPRAKRRSSKLSDAARKPPRPVESRRRARCTSANDRNDPGGGHRECPSRNGVSARPRRICSAGVPR